MTYCHASCSKKGQIKIQQMAFVLVAILIFFSIVALFYFSISARTLRDDAESIREQETKEVVRKMAGTPEFSWEIDDCASCVDFDKVLALKNRKGYDGFWRDIPYLEVVRVYPSYGKECSKTSYPECDSVKIVESDSDFVTHSAFVALCRYDERIDNERCDLGRIIMGFELT